MKAPIPRKAEGKRIPPNSWPARPLRTGPWENPIKGLAGTTSAVDQYSPGAGRQTQRAILRRLSD